MKKILVAILMMASFCAEGKAQLIAVKTNALMDVAMVPNLGLEVATSSSTSLCMNGFASWKVYGMQAKTYGIVPEFRYWLSGSTFNKFFIGAGATLAHYDIVAREIRYNGSSYGIGLNFGYDMWLSKHFTVEFHGGVGMYHHAHSRTSIHDNLPDLPKINSRGWSALPYQIGVSFVYIIK
mgnify:FL=1